MSHQSVGDAKGVRLEFPYFEETNLATWCFKTNQYFEFHQTQPTHKLLMASYHLQGKVMVWYQDAMDSGIFTNWDSFCRAIQVRFGPMAYNDPMEALTCHKQTSTVATYKAQFETISNRFRGLSKWQKLNFFPKWVTR